MFFNMFVDFFTYLKFFFSGDAAGLMKYNELNSLYKTFKSSKYRFIQKNRIITQLFVQKIFNLYENLMILKPFLESSLFSSDETKSKLLLNHFIESYLNDSMKKKRESFLKDLMLQKVAESENSSNMMKAIEQEFNKFKNFFTRYNLPRLETDYYLLYKVHSLSTFNFSLFFSKFDPDFNPAAGTMPSYFPVTGQEVLSEIQDLYFLVSSLPPKQDMTSVLESLYLRTGSSEGKILAKRAQKAIDQIYKLINNELSPTILLTMVRYISEDPKIRISVEKKPISILDVYRKEMIERFNVNKKSVMESFSQQSLQKDIKALFGKSILLPINEFSDNLIQQLEQENAPMIVGIQGVRIAKTFIFEKYEKDIKQVINIIILEGFFSDKDYQKYVSEVFYATNELKDWFVGTEESISTSNSNSFKSLQLLVGKKGNSVRIERTVETLNGKIFGINKHSTETIFKLGKMLMTILQEYKSGKKEKIENLHTLKGGQNKQFINKMAQGYSDITKFIKLMKNFVKN